MPPITDPEAIKFSNEKIRPVSDLLEAAYRSCKKLDQDWNAVSMSSKITNTSDLIEDGSSTDGRHQITGAEATAIVTRAQEFVSDYEATNNAKLNTVIIVSVNPNNYMAY